MLTASVSILLAAAQAPTLERVWSIRLQTEIQSYQVGETDVSFGTNDSYGAIDQSTGKKIWAKAIKSPRLGVFVAAGDGRFFASIGQGNLVAVDARSGKPVWSVPRTGYASPIAYLNRFVYAEVKPGVLGAIGQTGKVLWNADLGKSAPSVRPIRNGKSIFVGTKAGSVFGFDKDSGKLTWKHAERKSAVQALLVAGERLIATFDDGSILGLSLETGQKMWAVYTNNALFGTPFLRDGRIYAVSASGRFYNIAAETGQELWVKSLSFRQNFGLSQVLNQNGSFLLADKSKLVGLGPEGDREWEIETGSEMFGNQPRALGDDLLLVGSHEFRRVRLNRALP